MLKGCQKDMPKDRQTGRQIEDKSLAKLSYQNKSCSECQQDVRKSLRQTERYPLYSAPGRQSDRGTEGQNDSMTVWQNSRAAKEPALVVESLKIKDNNVPQNRIFLSKWLKSNDFKKNTALHKLQLGIYSYEDIFSPSLNRII